MLDARHTGTVRLGDGEIEYLADIVGMDPSHMKAALKRNEAAREALADILETDGVEVEQMREFERQLKLARLGDHAHTA